jgi:hypothetical protein
MSTLLVPPMCAFASSVILIPDFRFYMIMFPLMSGYACSPVARIPFKAEALIVFRQINGEEHVV